MKVDSLGELKIAFAIWRQAKRHVREAVPDDLLERARRTARVHGVTEVVKAVGVERSRIFRRHQQGATAALLPARPAFSRLALSPPVVEAHPVAELETPGGLKLRVFVESDAMVGLLSGLCERGEAR